MTCHFTHLNFPDIEFPGHSPRFSSDRIYAHSSSGTEIEILAQCQWSFCAGQSQDIYVSKALVLELMAGSTFDFDLGKCLQHSLGGCLDDEHIFVIVVLFNQLVAM